MSVLTLAGGSPLRGAISVPGDKSVSHRALLLGALAEGTSVVRNLSPGDDVARTMAAVRSLGASVQGERVTGGRHRLHEPAAPVDAGNSGTTMRLLAGLAAGFGWTTRIVGDESLSRRPMDRVAVPLRAMGASVEGVGPEVSPPLEVRGGGLRGIDYSPPVPSAQVKSAVLLAGLSAEGETIVRENVRTRAHTEEMLTACGADISTEDEGRTVRLRAKALEPFEIDVPGDPSQAAFWVVAACVVPGSELVLDDLQLGPARAGFLDVLARMGADVQVRPSSAQGAATGADRVTLTARWSERPLRGTDVAEAEMAGLIDEVPALAVAAAVAEGPTVFRGAAELRVKETDRVAALESELAAMGAKVRAQGDALVVEGGARLHGAPVRSGGDHRMAMALAVAALAAEGTTEIDGWEAVAVSYPGFEEDLRSCSS